MRETSRCTGHCCKDFSLPFSPMELKHQAELAKRGKGRFFPEEILKVADMVVFLFQNWSNSQDGRGLKKGRGSKSPFNGPQYHYTCRHFDRATGNCMNYENRPLMCQNFPYGRDCRYRGCTRRCEQEVAEKAIEEKECSSSPTPTAAS